MKTMQVELFIQAEKYGWEDDFEIVANRYENESDSRMVCITLNKVTVNIETKYVDAISTGCGLTLWAEANIPFGKTIVGKRGLSSEQIGKTIANQFITDWSNHGAIDEHLTDQLIPALGLIPTSTVLTGPLSLHTSTNIDIVEKFLPVNF